MSEVRALIQQLVDSGVDAIDAAEVITRAVLLGAASAPKARTAGAIRQERYRRNKASQVTEGDACDGDGKEKPPVPPKEITPPKPPKGGISPQSELEAVLDAEHAKAVVQHRQRLRKPLTPHAAKLLAAKFAKCTDPNAAADLMIERGWQGFEPDWAGQPVNPPAERRGWVEGITDDEARAKWVKTLNFARPRDTWKTWLWGPPPGHEGCLVPADLLEPRDLTRQWFEEKQPEAA